MADVLDRARDSAALPSAARGRRRPVVLATLQVRVDATAERVAMESALEAGVGLVVANMIHLPAYPMTAMLAPECTTLPDEEDLEAVRETAARAAALGIPTELLRVRTPRPVRALVELVQERDAGLLVFGPDRRRTSRWRLMTASRLIRKNAPCLVWLVQDG